jgi:hypothetical protein
MADGTKKQIDQVKVDDTVTATDPETGETGPHKVTALIRHKTDHTIIDVKVRGEHSDETIAATDHHPFYVTGDGGRWVDAGDLHAGDHLRSPDGTTRTVAAVSTRAENETVYNLTIDGDFAFQRLNQFHGVDRIEFGTQSHEIKAAWGLPADFDLSFGPTGDVWNSQSGELLGHILHGG